jgi:putative transcriptional regulator
MSYLEQQFLVAMPDLDDPNFTRGVTLLAQHNDDGALGLVVNRPSNLHLSDLFEQMGLDHPDPTVADQVVFEGGPLHRERGLVLHETEASDPEWDSSLHVGQHLKITTSKDILEAIAEGEGPAQLEQEIRDNVWLNVDAQKDIVFDVPVEQRWARAVATLGFSAEVLQPSGGHA